MPVVLDSCTVCYFVFHWYPPAFLIFFLLALVALAQLGWWVIFQINEGARLKRIQRSIWDQQIELAGHCREAQSLNAEEFQTWLRESFPDLKLETDGYTILVNSGAIARLEQTAGGGLECLYRKASFLF